MDIIFFRNVKPEDHAILIALLDKLNLTSEKYAAIERFEKRKERGTPSATFLSRKEEIKKDSTILCYENSKRIYFVDKLPDYPGTYLFFDKSNNLLYVGSTKNLSQRIPQSFVERNGKDTVSTIRFRICNTVEEARNLESLAINKFKPRLNTIIPPLPVMDIDLDELYGYTVEVQVWSEE